MKSGGKPSKSDVIVVPKCSNAVAVVAENKKEHGMPTFINVMNENRCC